MWIALSALACIVAMLLLLGVASAIVLSNDRPTNGGTRLADDSERRSVERGALRLVAPTVFGSSWSGTATCWRATSDGKLLLATNRHVAAPDGRAERLEVEFVGGIRLPVQAMAVEADRDADLALLVVDASSLREGRDFELITPHPGPEWSELREGDAVVAVGSPHGLPQTQTFGRISALRDRLPGEGEPGVRWIQLDATVLPGNSGGPLLRLVDDHWDWIGVVTARGMRGIGFAIHAGELSTSKFRWLVGAPPAN